MVDELEKGMARQFGSYIRIQVLGLYVSWDIIYRRSQKNFSDVYVPKCWIDLSFN